MLKKTMSIFMALFLLLQFMPEPDIMPAQASATGLNFYVDPMNGSDGNGGTDPDTDAWLTIEKARDHIRTINSAMTDDIIVNLMPGTFYLTNTLEFTPADSGTNGYTITYKAYDPGDLLDQGLLPIEDRPILSGGMKITGWEQVSAMTDTTLRDELLSGQQAGKNIWRARIVGSEFPVDNNPATPNPANVDSRQFYVNGVKAQRAWSGNLIGTNPQFSYNDPTGFNRPNGTTNGINWTTMHNWRNITNIEIAHQAEWKLFRGPVADVNSGGLVTFKEPFWGFSQGHDPYFRRESGNSKHFWVENAYELLTQPGEWYLDKGNDATGRSGYIYYIPRPGENMSTANAVLPVLEELMTIKGATTTKVSNLKFKGLDFAYATWTYPNSKFGYCDGQTGSFWGSFFGGGRHNGPYTGDLTGEIARVSATIVFEHTDNITVERCDFRALGSHGLGINYSKNIDIIGNSFTDIAAGGIDIGNEDCSHTGMPFVAEHNTQKNGTIQGDTVHCGYNGMNWKCYNTAVDPRDTVENINIKNNFINNVATDYWGNAAMTIRYAYGVTIEHNDVGNIPGMGISFGWGWGKHKPTYQGNFQVRNNYVHHFNLRLDDGSGIYGLGPHPNPENNGGVQSKIEGNYVFHNQGSYGDIYLDGGVEYVLIQNNVIEGSAKEWLYIQGWDAGENTNETRARFNTVKDNYYDRNVCRPYDAGNTITPLGSDLGSDFNNNRRADAGGTYVTGGAWPMPAQTIMSSAGLQPAYTDIDRSKLPGVPYTVTFDTDGGSTIAPITVDGGEKIPYPAVPIRTGYTLTGWFTDLSWTLPWNFASDTVQGDMTLYAGWKDPTSGGGSGGFTMPAPDVHLLLNGNLTDTGAANKNMVFNHTAPGYVTIPNTIHGKPNNSPRQAADNNIGIASDNITFSAGNYTFSAWYNVSAISTYPAFLYNGGSLNGTNLAYRDDSSNTDLNVAIAGSGFYRLSPPKTVNMNEWVHLAMVFRGQTAVSGGSGGRMQGGFVDLYMNGASVGTVSVPSTTTIHPPGDPTTPGDTNWGTYIGNDITAQIADVRLYEEPLTAEQIAYVYNEFFSNNTPGQAVTVAPPGNNSVTFKTNNGSADIVRSFEENTMIAPPDSLKNTGHIFDGWYTKDGTGDDWGAKWDFTTQKMPSVVFTLYAKWVVDTAPEIDKIIITRE